jgi:HEAT repeat protein
MEEKMIKITEKLNKSDYLKEIPKIFKKMEHKTRCETIEELGILLDNEDYDTRLKALKVLSELSVPEILPPIIDALETVKFYEYDIKRICEKSSRKKQTREDNVQNQESRI